MPMYSACDTFAGGFPHSEISGSKPICRLPAAYRRLSRPSSPIIAKASTTCTYSLDPITLPPQTTRQREPKSPTHHKEIGILTLVRLHRSIDGDTMQYITQCPHYSRASSQRPLSREQLPSFQVFKERRIWWVWMDSNHRPPPYQDGALTN